MRVSALGVAVVSLASAVPCVAQQVVHTGQEIFSPTARQSLRQAADAWAGRGFTPIEEPHIGILNEHERDSLSVPTERGRQYVIQGMCDGDCGVLDFRVYNAADSLIAAYSQSDGHPYVQLLDPDSTSYRLEVIMARCSVPPCYYAVQVLKGKPRPSIH